MHAVAALSAFDLPFLRPAQDAFWQLVRHALAERGVTETPAKLTRPIDERRLWTHPAIVLGQLDAYRFAQVFPTTLVAIAAPHYDCERCEGTWYRAVVVVRDGDDIQAWTGLAERTAAVEGLDHLGSWRLFKAWVQGVADPAAFFGRVVISGGSVESLSLVRSGAADYAVLDCVSWQLVREHLPAVARGLRVLAETDRGLAPPFVCSAARDDHDRHAIYAAVEAVVNSADAADVCRRLRLKRVEPASMLAYDAEPRPVASTVTLLSAARNQRGS
ncbi:MAG: phosphate/phosphite/phosphonate ABC transporter substrate-binding protein [Alphaproteobacteria bacterium]